MNSIELLSSNLRQSAHLVLMRIEEMKDYCVVYPTQKGGCHTLWVLGHLAYIEGLVIHVFMLGNANPLAGWAELFDGSDTTNDVNQYPPFDSVLARCREIRRETISLLDGFIESDLDKQSEQVPRGYDDYFGTYRQCFQYVSDHWYMHRGHLADARRSAGLDRMWV